MRLLGVNEGGLMMDLAGWRPATHVCHDTRRHVGRLADVEIGQGGEGNADGSIFDTLVLRFLVNMHLPDLRSRVTARSFLNWLESLRAEGYRLMDFPEPRGTCCRLIARRIPVHVELADVRGSEMPPQPAHGLRVVVLRGGFTLLADAFELRRLPGVDSQSRPSRLGVRERR